MRARKNFHFGLVSGLHFLDDGLEVCSAGFMAGQGFIEGPKTEVIAGKRNPSTKCDDGKHLGTIRRNGCLSGGSQIISAPSPSLLRLVEAVNLCVKGPLLRETADASALMALSADRCRV